MSDITEDKVLKYIGSHKNTSASEIHADMLKKDSNVSINTIRRLLRKLILKKKVIRTGVHTFRYKIRL